jgi:YesN/AraC family two-component response regulator
MIRLLLVDDQNIVRKGLKVLLESQPNFQVVGEAGNGREAIAQVEALQPDVVLMDVRMPEMDGVAATQIIKHYRKLSL